MTTKMTMAMHNTDNQTQTYIMARKCEQVKAETIMNMQVKVNTKLKMKKGMVAFR